MVQRLFRLAIFLCVCGYTAYTLWMYWEYSTLDTQVPLQTVKWSIHERDEEAYLYHVSYTYRLGDDAYENRYLFKKPVFINLLGAEHDLASFSAEVKSAWVSGQNPSYSSLQKTFPVKESISTAILWLIFIYFALLGKYYAYRYGRYHPDK